MHFAVEASQLYAVAIQLSFQESWYNNQDLIDVPLRQGHYFRVLYVMM